MLRISLPSSMDLKLCSNVPVVNFVDTWTFVTVFTSSIWVPSFGSRDGGSQHFHTYKYLDINTVTNVHVLTKGTLEHSFKSIDEGW